MPVKKKSPAGKKGGPPKQVRAAERRRSPRAGGALSTAPPRACVAAAAAACRHARPHTPTTTQLSAEEIYKNAEMAFSIEAFDKARSLFKRALDMEPEVRAGLGSAQPCARVLLPPACPPPAQGPDGVMLKSR